jgi:dephospho-CoA kinase
MTFIVGLTGGIGCGKSTIEKLFLATGRVAIIDTDVITHQLQQPGQAGFVFIKQAFGDIAVNFDGTLNRDYLRNLVFNDKEAKAKLEAIMTPLIYHVVLEEIKRAEGTFADYIILTVPLLLESKLFLKLVDRVLVIDCPESQQVERVMKRSGLTRKMVDKILQAQVPRYFRVMKADDVIHNYDNEPSDNVLAVDELHARYCSLAIQAKAA